MRSPWVLVSIVVHSLAIAAAAIAPLVAAVDRPAVHSPLPAYVEAFAKDIDLPPAPPRSHGPAPAPVNTNLAPLVAPPRITEESVGQQLQSDAPGIRGLEPPASLVEGDRIGIVVPPPDPPREQAPVRVSEGVKPPQKIVDVAPVYPAIAISARKEGIVILEAVIDTRGYVKDVRVLRSIPLLDDAAVDAVRQWRYTPTLLNGQPVSVIMTVTVNFTLGK